MEENKKILKCVFKENLRLLVQFINSENIQKEDILHITRDAGQYLLLYYK